MIDDGDILAICLRILRQLQRLLGALKFQRSRADYLRIVSGGVVCRCRLGNAARFGRSVGARREQGRGGCAKGQPANCYC